MNEQFFTKIYQTHYADLYRFVFSYLKSKEKTEDVVQETFMKFYYASVGSEEKIKSWLFSVSKNMCIDTLRKEKKETSLADEQNLAGEGEDYSDVLHLVDLLPEKYAEIIRLHYFGNMSIQEIAKSKFMSTESVKKRLQRGRGKLREMMKEE